MTTDENTEKLVADALARADAATPGPWVMTDQGGIESAHYSGPGEIANSVASARTFVDWKFIAHAREDVPALVAEVRRLQATLAATAAPARQDSATNPVADGNNNERK